MASPGGSAFLLRRRVVRHTPPDRICRVRGLGSHRHRRRPSSPPSLGGPRPASPSVCRSPPARPSTPMRPSPAFRRARRTVRDSAEPAAPPMTRGTGSAARAVYPFPNRPSGKCALRRPGRAAPGRRYSSRGLGSKARGYQWQGRGDLLTRLSASGASEGQASPLRKSRSVRSRAMSHVIS